MVDDYSPMLPPRKLTFPNSRSEFEKKRHASLHIEANENYQRMRGSILNDSTRAVYRNRLLPEDLVNTGPVAKPKPGSVSLTPNLMNMFPSLQSNQVKPSRSGQLENILEKADHDQGLQPISRHEQKHGSAPEIRFKTKPVAITVEEAAELVSKVTKLESILKKRTEKAIRDAPVVKEHHEQVQKLIEEHNRKKARFEKKPELKATREEARRLK